MVDATVPEENNHRTPTALGSQLEDPPGAATARAAPTEAMAALVAATVAAAEAAAVGAHLTVLVGKLEVAAITEAEATRTATSPASHVVATMLAIELKRFIAKRLLRQATVTASPPSPLDFATCFSQRNSNLSGSPSTTRSKTQFSSSGALPYPLKTLVAITT
jgi:hypothetical protein